MLRRTLLLLAILAGPVSASAAGAPAADHRYIVVLKNDGSDSRAVAESHSRRYGVEGQRTYRGALKGYAARIPRQGLDAVRNDRRVAYVEPDARVRAVGQRLPWGINRIDADKSSTRAGNGSGAVTGAHAFVLDTGIGYHRDLNVVNRVNFAYGPLSDCHGHGTRIAGVLGARDNSRAVVGVAPGVKLTSVKVLDCYGDGFLSDVLAGVDYVTRRARHTKARDVANVSIGGSASRALDDAVRRSARSGVFYAVAAGNDGANACFTSPARAGASSGIATVAATNRWDREPYWSNYGSCVDIWAPGVDILSTSLDGGISRATGTSPAAPHVAGAGALYRSRHSVGPRSLEWKLKQSARYPATRSKDGRPIRRLFVGGSTGF